MAVTVKIEGIGRIELDDSFRDLSPEQQQATIDEIVRSQGNRARSGVVGSIADADDRLAESMGLPPPRTPVSRLADSPLGRTVGAVGDAALGIGRQFTGGFNEALGRLAGGAADVDPIERGLGLAGEAFGFEPPRTPMRMASDALRSPVMAGPEPEGTGQRIVRRGGEVLGETIAPAGAMFGMARAGVGAAANAPPVRQAAGQILETIRQAPGASAAVERTSAIGAGLGGGAMREAFPDSQAAETFGELGGGLAAPLVTAYSSPALAARGMRGIGRAVTDRFTEEGAARRAFETVAPEIREHLQTTQAREGMGRAQELRQQIPGFEPSLAQQTELPALVATQQAVERGASGADLDTAIGRHQGSREAVEAFRRQAAPEGEPSAQRALQPLVDDRASAGAQLRGLEREAERTAALRQQAAEWVREQRSLARAGADETRIQRAEDALEIDTALRALNDQEKSALSAFDAKLIEERLSLAQDLRGPNVIDRRVLGGRIRGELAEARRQRSEEMSTLARDLGVNDADMAVPFGNFMGRVNQWQSAMRLPSQRENMPASMRDIRALAERVDAGAPITFQDIKALREGLNDELLELVRDTRPGFRKRLENAGQLKALVDDVLLGEELPGVDPVLAANYQTFRQRYFEDFIKPFEQGTVLDVRRKDGTGFYRTLDEEIAAEFLSTQEGARQFQAILGDNPQAVGDLTAVALDGLADAAVREGMISARGVETWMTRHRGALQELPQVRAVVDRFAGDVRGAFEQHRLASEQMKRAVAEQRQALMTAQREMATGRIADQRGRRDALVEIEEQFREQNDQLLAAQQRLDEAMTPLRERMGLLTERKMAREDRVLAQKLGAIEAGTSSEDALVREAMTSPRLMLNLRNRLGQDQEALSALRRKVWDDLGAYDGQGLAQFLDDNERSLRVIFSERHMKNLRDVGEALRMLDAVPPPTTGRPISADAIEEIRRATGFSPMQASSRWVNIASGRLSKNVAGFDFLMRTLNARREVAAEKLLREVLYNPQVADAVMAYAKAGGDAKPNRVLTAWLATQGIMNFAEGDD